MFLSKFSVFLNFFFRNYQPFADVLQNRCFLKIPPYSQENTCVESLFNKEIFFKELLLKRDSTQVFCYEYCEILKNTFFTECPGACFWFSNDVSFTMSLSKSPCISFSKFLLDKSEAATGGVSVRKGVLRNFAKFTRRHLCQESLFY